MHRSIALKLLYIVVILSMVAGSLPWNVPVARAEVSAEVPAASPYAPLSYPPATEDPTAFVSTAVGGYQLDIPLSRGSRNDLLSSLAGNERHLAVPDPFASLSQALGRWPGDLFQSTAAGNPDTLPAALDSRQSKDVYMPAPSAGHTPATVAESDKRERATAQAATYDPEPAHELANVFLPFVAKSPPPPEFTLITPAGGSIVSEEAKATITFAPDGLPESLRAAIVASPGDVRELPMNLYPFGSPFHSVAYWIEDEVLVDALDRDAAAVWEPGMVKPEPPDYGYWATVSVHLSPDDLEIVDANWLTIARLDSASGKWILLPTAFDDQSGVAMAQTERLGTFVLVQNMPNWPSGNAVLAPPNVRLVPSAVLTAPVEVIVDDLDPDFRKYQSPKIPPTQPSYWREVDCSSVACYEGHAWWTYNRSDYEDPWLAPGERCNWAKWTPGLPESGYYMVSVFVPGANATTAGADYEIGHQGITDTVTINQSDHSGDFCNLGSYEFAATGEGQLYLDDVVPETWQLGSQIGFDVAIFTFAGEEPPTPEELAELFSLGVRRWQKYVGDPVSSSTGNHVQQIDVVRIPGRDEFEMALALTYNALDDYEGYFGRGWSSILDTRLKTYYDGSVLATMPDGQGLYWQWDGGAYVPWDGVQAELGKVSGGWRLTLPDQTAFTFQEMGTEGRLMRVEDRHGNGADLLYAGDGRVAAMIDDAGRRLIFSYDGDYVQRVDGPPDRTWGFAYDGGRLSEFCNARGGTTRYTYTGDGHIEDMTDPEQIRYLHNVYDGEGRVIEQVDAAGSHSYWTYDDGSRTVTFADNLGRPAIYRYDEKYRLVEEEDLWGNTVSYEYDDDYNLTARVDKMGRRWEYNYDDRGNLLGESGPLGWHVEYTYNDTNDLTSVTDPVRGTTKYVWSGEGNLERVEYPDQTADVYTYDAHGQTLSATDPNQHTTRFGYDTYGNLETVRTPLGCITRYEYDLAGRMAGMTDGNGHSMSMAYDGNDNVTRIVDPRGRPTDFEYDGNDSLTKMIDRRRGEWRYGYDQNLKLVSEIDPEGHETRHAYDEMYSRVSTTDPRLNTTWFRYDELYRLAEVEDALHNVTRYEYNANDNLVLVVDALLQETEMQYDELNRLTLVVDALDGETEFYYDAVSRLERTVNPRDAETRYSYDALDRLTLVINAMGGETEYDYDDAGNLVLITDANEHTTWFRYDADDRLIKQEDPEGHVTAYGYDCVGNLISQVDARLNPTTFFYDENDNLVLVVDALQGETEYTYDEEDAVTSVTDPNDHTTTFVYNLDGLQVRLIEAGGQVTEFGYDAAHNLIQLTNARNNVSRFEYDELNRLVRAYDPLSNPTVYSYDALSRLTSTTDANEVVTRYEYDALDRLTAVVQNNRPGLPADHETNVRTEYGYDATGNLKIISDANTYVTEFFYDPLDRLTREVNPLGSTWRYEYDPVGNLVRRIDANQAVTDYEYDDDDLLIGIYYPNGSAVTYGYDEAHNQVSMTDALGTTRNTYDALNRLASSTNHLDQSVGYGYDPASNRTSVTYPDDRTVRTEYDPTNYPQRVIDPDGNVFEAEYDPTHNLTAAHYPNLTHALMTYDAADRLLSVLNEQLDGDVISRFDYTLDPVGNRTHVEDYYRWPQPRELTHNYAYDPLYRLVDSLDSEGRHTEYAYDAAGNRLEMASNYDPLRTPTDVDPYTVAYAYNEANQLLSTDHNEFGVTAYTYDANGNRVRRQGPDVWIGNPHDQLRTDYVYDYENRLTWVGNFFDPGNDKWQVRDETAMQYDGYGRLFRRTYDQHQGGGGQSWTEFVYDGLDPIVEYVDPSPQYTNYYRGLGRILEQHDFKSQTSPAGTATFYHYDGLGSVSALTKHRGQSAHEYRYWDYGMVLDKNDRAADSSDFTDPHNHYTYTGQEWEEHTWLYHFYAREYDPVVGVWLQQDPYRGRPGDPMSLHRYGYVGNNPINWRDWLGHEPVQSQAGNYQSVLDMMKQIEQSGDKSRAEVIDEMSELYKSSEQKVRYIYTETYGWIDLKHFFAAAAQSRRIPLVGDEATELMGGAVEIRQCLTHDPSCFSYEDIGSNAAGADFGQKVAGANLNPFNKQSASQLFEEFVSGLDPKDYLDDGNNPRCKDLPEQYETGQTSKDTESNSSSNNGQQVDNSSSTSSDTDNESSSASDSSSRSIVSSGWDFSLGTSIGMAIGAIIAGYPGAIIGGFIGGVIGLL